MTKSSVIWTIIIIVLVALGIWYSVSSRRSAMTGDQTVPTTNTVATSTNGGATTGGSPSGTVATKASFKSIFTQTGNYQCTYEQVTSSTRASSLIDIADGKMHGEFRTTDGSGSSANLMIYSGGSLYVWKEGATTGTKSSIKTLAELPAVIPADLTSGAIFGVSSNSVGWDCHDWIKDTSKFTIPSYVKFSVK